MKNSKKKYKNGFKATVALEAIKGEKTLAEISSEYKVHPSQINKWKRKALDELPEIYSDKRKKETVEVSKREDELLKQIGQLTMELEWLKKKSSLFS